MTDPRGVGVLAADDVLIAENANDPGARDRNTPWSAGVLAGAPLGRGVSALRHATRNSVPEVFA